MCRPLCEDRSNVGRQLYFFKIAARSAFRSTLHTAERLAAASEGGTRDVALQQREQRSERLEGPRAGAFGSFPLKITKKSSFKVSVGRTTFDYGHNKSLCKITCI